MIRLRKSVKMTRFVEKIEKTTCIEKRCRKIREQNRAVLRIMIKISKITAVSRKNKR